MFEFHFLNVNNSLFNKSQNDETDSNTVSIGTLLVGHSGKIFSKCVIRVFHYDITDFDIYSLLEYI